MEKTTIRSIATEVSILSATEQKRFLKEYFNRISQERKIDIIEYIMWIAYPKEKWNEVELWLEKRFIKNIKLMPYKAAMMCMRYNKIDVKMKPLFIKIAQKVKNRVYNRNKFQKKEKK